MQAITAASTAWCLMRARAGGVALWVFLFLLGQHVLHVGVVQHVGQQGFAVGLKPSAHAQVGNHSPQLAG